MAKELDAAAFRRLVGQLRIDVIHIHTEGNFLRTVLVAKWALRGRGSVIRTVHNVFDARGKWRAQRIVQAWLADRLLSAVTAPSRDVAMNEKTIGREAEVVLNWVDDRMWRIRDERAKLPDRRPVVPTALIVGNCSGIKNHELAVRAVAISGHRLVHLGDESGASPEETRLLDELEQEGRLLSRGVHDPDTALLESDYFAMPSLHEGMPVALAEALAVGLPALISDMPGLRWAAFEPGVVALPLDHDVWLEALKDLPKVILRTSQTDFSAERGAREYADIYRAGVSGQNRQVGGKSANVTTHQEN